MSATSAGSVEDAPCSGGAADEVECLVLWVRSGGDSQAATSRLEARLDGVVEPAGGPLALGLAEVALSSRRFGQVVELASNAVRRCLFAADPACELRARHLKAYALSQTNRHEQAIWEAEKAYSLAAGAESARERYKIGVMLARLRLSGLVDLGRVERLLDEIQPLADEADSRDRRYALSARAVLLHHLGYLDQAALAFARSRDLAQAAGDPVMSASDEFNRIDSLFKSGALKTSASRRSAAVAALVTLVERDQTPTSTRLRALALLAQLETAQAPRHLRRCLRIATAVDDPRSISRCAAELAILILEGGTAPGESTTDLIEIAARAAKRSSNPNADLQLTRARMVLHWNTRPAAIALDLCLELLVSEGSRRRRQTTEARQREFLAFLNQDHYWLAGKIAAEVAADGLPAQKLEIALGLLEAVRHARGREADRAEPVADQVREWSRAATALRGSREPPLDQRARSRFAALEQMPTNSGDPSPPVATPPSLDFGAIRQGLGPHQAIAVVQWQPEAGAGGHWIYLLTADAIRARPLARPGAIELALTLLNSSVRRGESAATERSLARLHGNLIAPMLEDLAGIERLVVIPDAAVHAAPIHALGRLDSRLVGIEVYPALGAWPGSHPEEHKYDGVRIFANPTLPSSTTAPPGTRLEPQRLPGAEREALALTGLLGARAILTRGGDATETRALGALSSDAGVVHFATHAVLNEANPSASSIILAPDEQNDGWLTLGQIANLDILPKLIVLSACEAGSGRALTGEGLIGLSSGFLSAGASAVLANLWPVDDAHAAVFIQRLYRLMTDGETLEQALTRAANDLAEAGYPATAWAGWTIIGDGSSKLASQSRSPTWALALGLALLLTAAGAAYRRRR